MPEPLSISTPLVAGAKPDATPMGSAVAKGRRSGLLGAGGRRAFVVEAMLLLAFLGTVLALVLQLFAASSSIGRQAHADSMMHQLADNAAQGALVGAQPSDQELYFDAQGQSCVKGSAAYCVEVKVDPAPSEDGQLVGIHVQARTLDLPEARTFSIDTMRCLCQKRASETETLGGAS